MTNHLTEKAAGSINNSEFNMTKLRVIGELTLPLINQDVEGRMSMHGMDPIFTDGYWAAIAMIEDNRVLCTSGIGESRICCTVDEATQTMKELYMNAEKVVSFFDKYHTIPAVCPGTVSVERLNRLKAIIQGEMPHIKTYAYRPGNLQFFNSSCNCASPSQIKKWCDVSMLINGAAICSASNGDIMVCHNSDKIEDFITTHI